MLRKMFKVHLEGGNMRYIKAIISNLALLSLALIIFAGSKTEAKAVVGYNLYVGGINVTTENKDKITWSNDAGTGYATFDSTNNVLTFYDAKITTTKQISDLKTAIYIKWSSNFTIKGNLTIEITDDSYDTYGIYYKCIPGYDGGLTIDGNITIKGSDYGIKVEDGDLLFDRGKISIDSKINAVMVTGEGPLSLGEGMIISEPSDANINQNGSTSWDIRKRFSSSPEKKVIIDKTYGNKGPFTIDLTSGSATVTGEQAELVYNTAIFAKKSLILGDINYLKHPVVFDLDGDSNGDLSVTIVQLDHDFESISLSVLDSCNYYGDFVLTEDDIMLDKLDKYHYSYYSPFTLKLPAKKVDTISNPSAEGVKAEEKTENIDPSLKNAKSVKLTAGKKSITISWKKLTKKQQKQIAGFEIQCSTDKSFKENVKTVNVGKAKSSKKISKLTPKKKYFVRIRVYKKNGSEKVYSSWSTPKGKKVK